MTQSCQDIKPTIWYVENPHTTLDKLYTMLAENRLKTFSVPQQTQPLIRSCQDIKHINDYAEDTHTTLDRIYKMHTEIKLEHTNKVIEVKPIQYTTI